MTSIMVVIIVVLFFPHQKAICVADVVLKHQMNLCHNDLYCIKKTVAQTS